MRNQDEIDGHNVCNVRCEPNRHSRIKVEYVKDKINKQETNIKDKNIRVVSSIDKNEGLPG